MSYCGECYYQGKKLKPCSTCWCGSEAKTECTNADRIRSMNDAELAEKLIHKQNGKWICSDMEIFSTKEVAIVHELHWLQSEAE